MNIIAVTKKRLNKVKNDNRECYCLRILDGKTIVSVDFDRQSLSKVKFGYIDLSDTFKQKYITDERTGFQYELVGDYYLLAGEDEPEENKPIGIWGKEHLQFIKNHRQLLFYDLLFSNKLNDYLSDIDKQAEETFTQLIDDMAKSECITENLKEDNQMEWMRRMNNIQSRAREIVNSEIIYT